jgi:acetyltransferase-like isoleucine patch superfamily enzyme
MKWRKARIGTNSFIELSVSISQPYHVQLGNNSYISRYTTITNDFGRLVLGNHSHIAPNCVINCYRGNVTCGDNVGIGPGTCLICHSNGYEPYKLITECVISKDIIIGNNVLIGANASILPGISIGANSIVGAGAVVMNDVPPNTIVGGVPAHFVNNRVY